MKTFVFVALLATVLGFSTLTHANLIDNGGGLIYDTDLNITWYDAPDVARTWTNSVTWAQGLNVGGMTGWRLPSTVDGPFVWGYNGTTTGGYNITSSEMGHLYYTEFNNKGYRALDGSYPQPGWGLVNKGPFTNLLQDDLYWSGTEYATDTNSAWVFSFYGGGQGTDLKDDSVYAVAVHSGNVSPVPIPPTIWLLGSGLIGLAGLRRKFKK